MVEKEKYIYLRYSKKYQELFKKEKRRLSKILPKSKIEHIGSSAVKNLGGKGIIDITISVPKTEVEKAIKKLQNNRYVYKPYTGDEERKFLQKIIKYNKKERRVHIQLTYYNSKKWEEMIAVRDYLNQHKDEAKKYSLIKKNAVKYAGGDGKRYRKYKDAYLKKLVKKSLP